MSKPKLFFADFRKNFPEIPAEKSVGVVNAGGSSFTLDIVEGGAEVSSAIKFAEKGGRVEVCLDGEVVDMLDGLKINEAVIETLPTVLERYNIPQPDVLAQRVVCPGFGQTKFLDEELIQYFESMAPYDVHVANQVEMLPHLIAMFPNSRHLMVSDAAFYERHKVGNRWFKSILNPNGVVGFHGLQNQAAFLAIYNWLGNFFERDEIHALEAVVGNGVSLTSERIELGVTELNEFGEPKVFHAVTNSMRDASGGGVIQPARSGNANPTDVLRFAEAHPGRSMGEIANLLCTKSGLSTICGSSDWLEILTEAEAGKPEFLVAMDTFLHSFAKEAWGMIGADLCGEVDCLIFHGTPVENNLPFVRELISSLHHEDFVVDEKIDDGFRIPEGFFADISAEGSKPILLVGLGKAGESAAMLREVAPFL